MRQLVDDRPPFFGRATPACRAGQVPRERGASVVGGRPPRTGTPARVRAPRRQAPPHTSTRAPLPARVADGSHSRTRTEAARQPRRPAREEAVVTALESVLAVAVVLLTAVVVVGFVVAVRVLRQLGINTGLGSPSAGSRPAGAGQEALRTARPRPRRPRRSRWPRPRRRRPRRRPRPRPPAARRAASSTAPARRPTASWIGPTARPSRTAPRPAPTPSRPARPPAAPASARSPR